MIICDEVIKLCDEEIKTTPTNFNDKKVTCKTQSINYYSIVDSCQYLLLSDKVLSKKVITIS